MRRACTYADMDRRAGPGELQPVAELLDLPRAAVHGPNFAAARFHIAPRSRIFCALVMRSSDVVLLLGALASSAFACAARSTAEATELPASPSRAAEGSCKHELGRCGGHKPGDGACGAAAPDTADAAPATPTPLEDVVLAPGAFAEIDLEMAAGAATEVTFQATGGPLEWNVHSHDGDAVTTHAEGTGATGQVRFAAPAAGLYSYMWKNTGGATVRLTARLAAQGTVRVRSIHPAPPRKKS